MHINVCLFALIDGFGGGPAGDGGRSRSDRRRDQRSRDKERDAERERRREERMRFVLFFLFLCNR